MAFLARLRTVGIAARARMSIHDLKMPLRSLLWQECRVGRRRRRRRGRRGRQRPQAVAPL